MTVTVASLRGHLTEFADGDRFPNAMVDYWIAIAAQLVNVDRWGTLTDNGVEMFVAHNIVLERRAMDEAARGAIPGASVGLINEKRVDKVSIGYDTASGAELDAGHWNLTIYGTRYIRMARLMGAGPLQIGIGCLDANGSASAYSGPWYTQFPNPSG